CARDFGPWYFDVW
nr:immunoglobulin heavy chain junction region [Mus musculus]